jgi:hypothetical protein
VVGSWKLATPSREQANAVAFRARPARLSLRAAPAELAPAPPACARRSDQRRRGSLERPHPQHQWMFLPGCEPFMAPLPMPRPIAGKPRGASASAGVGRPQCVLWLRVDSAGSAGTAGAGGGAVRCALTRGTESTVRTRCLRLKQSSQESARRDSTSVKSMQSIFCIVLSATLSYGCSYLATAVPDDQ